MKVRRGECEQCKNVGEATYTQRTPTLEIRGYAGNPQRYTARLPEHLEPLPTGRVPICDEFRVLLDELNRMMTCLGMLRQLYPIIGASSGLQIDGILTSPITTGSQLASLNDMRANMHI